MRKRILYVIGALANYGGIERVVTDKLNYLAQNSDYDIYLLTFDQGNHPIVFILHPNIVIEDLNITSYQEYFYSGLKRLFYHFKVHKVLLQKLKQRIVEISPDIVVCCQRQFVAAVEKSRGNVPLVFECHSGYSGDVIEGASLWQRIQVRWGDKSVHRAQCVVTLTNGDAAEWRKLNTHVVVIPNLVHLNDTGVYSNCLSKTVIFVGRYSVQKDIGSLLQIWKIVNSRHPDWKLQIFGGYGNEQGKWTRVIEQMQANIVLNEPTSHIFDKYIECSLLLLTSIHEPFGLVLPEAMSCGLPVVSFDCPYGPADIITDGSDGFLVKDRDIDIFANRVCQLIENTELRQKMGKSAIVSAQRYRAELIMPKWYDLFDRIINQR